MIFFCAFRWGEEKRAKDADVFCQMTIENIKCKIYRNEEKLIWIVTDARRHSDLMFFKENYQGIVKFVRVIANDEIRKTRGWIFTDGIFLVKKVIVN